MTATYEDDDDWETTGELHWELPIGCRVMYSGSWGSDAPRLGTIVSHEEKNGLEAYGVELDEGVDDDDRSRWGYAEQFTIVND